MILLISRTYNIITIYKLLSLYVYFLNSDVFGYGEGLNTIGFGYAELTYIFMKL